MWCKQLVGNAEPQKSPKISHLSTIAQPCRAIFSQLRHVLTVGKKLVRQQYFPTCLHNMVNFGPLTAEIGSLVWAPQQISTGFVSCPPGYLRNHMRDLYQFFCVYGRHGDEIPRGNGSFGGFLHCNAFVAKAIDREGGDGRTQRRRSLIYDCLVVTVNGNARHLGRTMHLSSLHRYAVVASERK